MKCQNDYVAQKCKIQKDQSIESELNELSFIKVNFKIAKCLNDLLGENGPAKNRRKWKSTQKATKWKWKQEHQHAFNTLIEKLMSPTVLAFPDYNLPFILPTDVSHNGLGAVLYQLQNGRAHVVAYASRGLKKSEQNYPDHKLEFLSLKWAVTEKFKDLLYGHNFEVVTEKSPLTYVLSSAKLGKDG